MIPISERFPNEENIGDEEKWQTLAKTRMAMPGVITEFNASEQTVTVQPAIRECRVVDGEEMWVNIPLLVDVPIIFPRAGGYVLTMPIKPGDECLVVFGDMCIDAWWQSGGVQNQIDFRRHDLSDAFAIPGPWSQPKVVSGYSTNSVQLRNEAGTAYFEIKGDVINIKATTININGGRVNIN